MIMVRCPACQTVFRVRPEQLRTHAAMVRCGHCYTPFNALAHLLDELPQQPGGATPTAMPREPDRLFVLEDSTKTSPPPPADHVSPSAAPGEDKTAATIRPAPRSPSSEPQTTFDRFADRLEFEIPDEFLPTRSPAAPTEGHVESTQALQAVDTASNELAPDRSREHDPRVCAATQTDERQAAVPQTRPDIAATAMGAAPKALRYRKSARRDASALQPIAEHFGPASRSAQPRPQIAAAWADPVAEPTTRDDFAPVHAAAQTPHFAAAGGYDARRWPDVDDRDAKRNGQGGGRWLWGLAVGILAGALAVQAAYLFRLEITRNWPQLRPAYVQLCAHFACTMPLPRVATAIRIDSSDLESDPADPVHFVLNARIRNHAQHPQEHPHLELTLTDARDRPVVRRVLTPEDWVAPERLADGFLAGEEIDLRQPFLAPGVTTAVGYRVYAFFP